MPKNADRTTADLSNYPDLVVIYLGMRVRRVRGLATLLGFGPKIRASWKAEPDGLLLHEDVIWSLVPPNVGMRQYWRDLDSLERWARSEPHKAWWQKFLRDTGGTEFWHEAYTNNGPIESVYDDVRKPIGLGRFAPLVQARGPAFSLRGRVRAAGRQTAPAPLSEAELYTDSGDATQAQDAAI
jgi:hypothetical protein